MNPNKQRIAIAEHCGWVFMDGGNFSGIDYKSVKPPHGLTCTMSHTAAILSTPDYLNDLNAMNSAEKTLNVKSATKFAEILGEVVLDNGCGDYRENMYMLYCLQHANSTQRAEAFLKAIGKWEE
jgi:hypothetical protein